MTVIVPRLYRGRPSPSGIAPGRPVSSSSEWAEISAGLNWLIGKGAVLVPYCSPSTTVPKSASRTFRFRVRPRGLAIARQWSVWAYCATPGVTQTITVTPTGGSATTFSVSDGSAAATGPALEPLVLRHSLSARVSTEGEVALTIAASANSDVYIYGIECRELDRTGIIANSTDHGVLPETVRPRAPIIDVVNVAMGGITNALANCDPRPVGILHVPCDTNDAFARTSATFASITTLPFRVQVPKLTIGGTTGSVKWSAYARMATSGGAGGSVRLTTTGSALSDTATVTGTSYAWTTARTVSMLCDDFVADDGYVSEDLTIAIAGDGTRAVNVAGVSIWVDSMA